MSDECEERDQPTTLMMMKRIASFKQHMPQRLTFSWLIYKYDNYSIEIDYSLVANWNLQYWVMFQWWAALASSLISGGKIQFIECHNFRNCITRGKINLQRNWCRSSRPIREIIGQLELYRRTFISHWWPVGLFTSIPVINHKYPISWKCFSISVQKPWTW